MKKKQKQKKQKKKKSKKKKKKYGNLLRKQFIWNVETYFLGKGGKHILKCRLLYFLHSILGFK